MFEGDYTDGSPWGCSVDGPGRPDQRASRDALTPFELAYWAERDRLAYEQRAWWPRVCRWLRQQASL